MALNKALRDKIVAQALVEIQFARNFKQSKVKNWQKNEDLYYSRKQWTDTSRANVDLGRMQEFVHTLLSKVDNPLVFKFTKRKDSQLKRVNRLNALRQADQQNNDWDIKDLVGKKQAIIYGRAVYSYYADSQYGYCAHLDPVDVYDFLIDPSAGGVDMEQAMFLGDYGVTLTKKDLREGVDNEIFIRAETERLIRGQGNANEQPVEVVNQQNRTNDTGVTRTNKEIGDTDKFRFWRWCTTYDGERYYLLLNENGATAIRVELLSDVFASGLWPYWSWAAFPDLTEFWTPSYCDYVREIFMAQAVSINQMLDNAEQINKPQRLVSVGLIENLAELKYRRDGQIKVKGQFDVNKAYQIVEVKSIDTPIKVFQVLEGIQEKASGVTAGAKGVSDEDKVGIYQGNEANAADRFGLLNKSYAFGYKRFAKLYEFGVREHLTKKVAVDIIGPNGVETEEISRRDIFWKNDTFNVSVQASDAELAVSEKEKANKIAFLTNEVNNQNINPKKAFEMKAQIAGFNEEEIRQLLDTSEFGDAELMSEAERDIEMILDGKNIKPNRAANTAYKQRFIDYMNDHDEDIDADTFARFVEYVASLDQVIMNNTLSMAKNQILKQSLNQVGGTGQGVPTPTPQVEDINKVTA